MAVFYSVDTVRALERKFREQDIFRPFRVRRYEPGTVLDYEVRGVIPDGRAKIKLEIQKFVGGGFAGQVYKVICRDIEILEGDIHGLERDRAYAVKIFIPPSGFSRSIRSLVYIMGFQGPFSLQVTPAAGRSQALWQKFIRRAAKIEFGSENAVVDVLATLIDANLGSCGEISEWVDGRMWRFEADDDLDNRRRGKPGRPDGDAGSPEYRTKREFMARLVRLMRRIGAVELARQYEWWSLKSQPNAMKRTASDPDPKAGLVAVDFRAGMVLTPVTPQCPADIKLVFQGLARGRLVQFDKGNLNKLEEFVDAHPGEFADMRAPLESLKREDRAYRDSLIDFTYHHVRLFGRKLRRAIMGAFRQSWRVRNITDERTVARLEKSGLLSLVFLLLAIVPVATPALLVFAFPGRTWWLYPLWALPLFAPFLRGLWGRTYLRRHWGAILTSAGYFMRASRARIAEALIRWHRAGRVSEERALKIADKPWRYYLHLPFSLLPSGLHRFLTDKRYFRQRLFLIFVKPVRLYFKAEEREKWLHDMIAAGERNGMLTRDEASHIDGQIKEPFIQKYLKSLAIHILLMPTTHVVALITAFIYLRFHSEMTWQQAGLTTGVIFAIFQIIPISPGSIARGIYTSSLILREKNFKNYNIAFWMSFFKYIGYFAFPVQMAYRYPDLARFMAGHWATSAVHIVPVFGEKGAWLEHFVFDVFYNFPLTIRRRMKLRQEARAGKPARSAHAPALILAATALLALLDFAYFRWKGNVPALGNIWWAALWAPLLASAAISRLAGGAAFGRRLFLATLSGGTIGLFYAMANTFLPPLYAGVTAGEQTLGRLAVRCVWHIFLFTLVAVAGALIAETRRVR
ncbi:MAG: hypothetical protein ABSF88_08725 [Candidatus Aminicenantales bacterium]